MSEEQPYVVDESLWETLEQIGRSRHTLRSARNVFGSDWNRFSAFQMSAEEHIRSEV